MRILNDASIDSIYKICSEESFTHVHILAHGGTYEDSGEQRFGLILCDPKDKTKPQHVSGATLASALQAKHKDGTTRSSPIMVTLATCDSGAQGSLLTPGGSLAYDLHVSGIPWVIASQFPLSKKGSIVMTRELFSRILRGDDPREALFEIRRILCTQVYQMHDWASLVIYASLPQNFESQVRRYFESQTKAAIETAMKHADDILKEDPDDKKQVAKKTLEKVSEYLTFWQKRLPNDQEMSSRLSRTVFFNISGSVHKRIALLYGPKSGAEDVWSSEKRDTYLENLRIAMANYDQAIEQWGTFGSKYHWAATQYLSLKAVLYWFFENEEGQTKDRYKPDDRDFARYVMAKELALKNINMPDSSIEKAWAYATLAELEMLSKHYGIDAEREYSTIENVVVGLCQSLIKNVGPNDFTVKSTQRQFERYKLYWGTAEGGDIDKIAGAAIAALT